MLATSGLALALCVSLTACNPAGNGNASVDTAAVADAVKQVEAANIAAFNAKDMDKIAASYDPGAKIVVPEAPAMNGSDVATGFGPMLKDAALKLELANEKTEVAAAGDLAYTRGTFRITETDAKTGQPKTSEGNYLTVFKKQADGSWKLLEDFNAAAPAPPADAAVPPPAG
jgi:ketosteroid isomerase-like protein